MPIPAGYLKALVAAVCSKCLWDFSPWALAAIFATLGGGIVTSLLITIRTLMKVYKKGLGPPPRKDDTTYDGCVLARFLPEIKGKVLWKKLGNYPTPVHKLTLSKEGNPPVSIQVKREDLSNDIYGGNKVRSLEFLLPGPEQQQRPISAFGAPGSNQIVATAIHTRSNVTGIYLEKEAGDRDNALNILSFISYPDKNTILPLFASFKPLTYLKIHRSVDTSPVLFPGGAHPEGVLGNAAGFLEYVEQVKNGHAEPVDTVILPLGSGCTTAGMVLGLAIAEFLQIVPSMTQTLKVHAVIIHHILAFGQQKLGGARWFIKQLVKDASQILIDCGAVPASVQKCAVELASNMDRLHLTPYRGEAYGNPIYGKHSDHSKAAKQTLMENSSLKANDGSAVPPIWLCSTFTSKAAAIMLDELKSSPTTRFLFWQTKSAIQPVNKHIDEWGELEKQHPWVKNYVSRNVTNKDEYQTVVSKL
eukprot:TRINITY_DN3041_c0_g5_i1.p1 TRINITY_DN3041_c0_g5~~TRINITY_DN3041_c0_g5_i1.p1  ORF type:complete len:492 (+),score=62.07 TRINITY_DN3041_c0_g5_i1:56-1477(+)